ncbi:MAG: tRNA pseudouridine(55) synthase TruB [Chloroflexi bacterium]|nr:tRNA pseudouridine(55) synthase TruB [Chloroflexota bacterium]MCY3582052.1 tRNA pseudouridine(55) synthase TruB [Chloroflexota bacterium]MCY3715331.1 tRNA pseudouridine(55) synthase TruB [Chloroflexota bacterium]MDE2649540.1 tRNA pseudouridine(55) synthase TruB [Chloroflexota bacterium]MXX52325.1 tRNA pseudouridine(55) synthase TruB [Chloroflexota bacterium]
MPGAYSGFLNINKPLRMTSHDVVARIRRRSREQGKALKVGHVGTLDPLAGGVLVICLGAATRLSEYMMRGQKGYRAKVRLGIVTSSYDAAGEVIQRADASQITLAEIRAALPQFIGEIQQVPPMHSAIKVQGRKLYELARQGKTITRQPRAITIQSLQVRAWQSPLLELEIRCGSGTYIRSLAHDLGAALGVGAHLAGLTRTASGNFTLADSLELEALLQCPDWSPHIVPPWRALCDYPRLELAADDITRLRNGQFIERRGKLDAPAVFGFDRHQNLVAILQPRGERWKPRKVFPPATEDMAKD